MSDWEEYAVRVRWRMRSYGSARARWTHWQTMTISARSAAEAVRRVRASAMPTHAVSHSIGQIRIRCSGNHRSTGRAGRLLDAIAGHGGGERCRKFTDHHTGMCAQHRRMDGGGR